ncbi:hypothetical protein [Glycomyces sp. NPDC047010]|uniref:hypothetical protein n=1 Tax=Glycomyces sp. NPDC047010 TaxID=3155023 RepID=UPI0033D0084C
MTKAHRAAAAAIRGHADRVEELRYRLEAVRFASTLIDRSDIADRPVLAWLHANLEQPVQRQDGIVEYLTVNFTIATQRLRATAGAFEGRRGAPALAQVTAASYWAPKGRSAPSVDFSAKPDLNAKIDGLARSMDVRTWAVGALAEPGASPLPERDRSAAGPALLHDVETALQVQPEVFAAQVRAWRDMSAELQRIAQELQDLLEHDMPEWTGEAHAAYCWLMDHNVNSAVALSATAAGLASAVDGVGVVIASTLARLRGRTDGLAARLTARPRADGPGTAVQQLVATVPPWAVAVARDLAALVQSLDNLKARLSS